MEGRDEALTQESVMNTLKHLTKDCAKREVGEIEAIVVRAVERVRNGENGEGRSSAPVGGKKNSCLHVTPQWAEVRNYYALFCTNTHPFSHYLRGRRQN